MKLKLFKTNQFKRSFQSERDRAKYGSYLIKELSVKLTDEFGKGFTEQNLRNMRQFYNSFPIHSTLCSELSWSHIRLKDEKLGRGIQS